MSGKAIFRMSKLKSFGAIAGAEHHNRRTRTTLNADPDREQDNFVFMGEVDRPLEELAKERIGGQTIRKNAVLAIDVFISASPEYFRPGEPDRAGYWEREKFEAWLGANEAFLKREFGEQNILRAECHLDESTPHIHAVVVPLTQKGKLSYRQLYGGKRTELSELQDRAWEAVADLGIERGLKGSQAQHREVQDWYAEMQRPLEPDLDQETVRVQLADRSRLEQENEQLKQQAAAIALTLEKRNQEKQSLLQQSLLMQEQLKATRDEAMQWREKYGQLVDPLRLVSLEKVAEALCLESDHQARPTWRHQGHQIRINGTQFYDWHETQMKGGGGAIDLVMHVHQSDFKSAVAWLSDRFGEEMMIKAGSEYAKLAAQEAGSPRFEPPTPAVEKWAEVRSYFVGQQLPGGLIDALHDQGLLYADGEGNAVFLQRDLHSQEVTGAYRQNGDSFSGTVLGSDRERGRFYWLRGGQPEDAVKQVVVGQTPMDAVAIGVMRPVPAVKTMYLSVDGVMPTEYLRECAPNKVTVAMNQDELGQHLVRQAQEELSQVRQIRPKQVDWMEELKRDRQLLIQRQLQAHRKVDRGLEQ
jgi:Plasmid recombination enzyme